MTALAAWPTAPAISPRSARIRALVRRKAASSAVHRPARAHPGTAAPRADSPSRRGSRRAARLPHGSPDMIQPTTFRKPRFALHPSARSAMVGAQGQTGLERMGTITSRQSHPISYPASPEGEFAALAVREVGPAAAPTPRLLDRVREAIRARHYSRRTEKAYVAWIRITRSGSFGGSRSASRIATGSSPCPTPKRARSSESSAHGRRHAQNAGSMKKARSHVKGELRRSYKRSDFPAGFTRGKYAARLAAGSNVVVLSPENAAAFPTSDAVNEALNGLVRVAKSARLTSRSSGRRSG